MNETLKKIIIYISLLIFILVITIITRNPLYLSFLVLPIIFNNDNNDKDSNGYYC